uniref:Secreted protein n=1 Tax=Panagrellus redivivus TaxID=6233 RepID=A0A7E4VVF9_PANRE
MRSFLACHILGSSPMVQCHLKRLSVDVCCGFWANRSAFEAFYDSDHISRIPSPKRSVIPLFHTQLHQSTDSSLVWPRDAILWFRDSIRSRFPLTPRHILHEVPAFCPF